MDDGLISLKVYNSKLKRNHENSKIELKTDIFDEFSFEEFKSELEEIVNNSNTSNEHFQDEEVGPRIISAYKKLQTVKRMTDRYHMLLMDYAGSTFRDFESYLRILVASD